LTYVEPYLAHKKCEPDLVHNKREPETRPIDSSENKLEASPTSAVVTGKAYVLGDFVDTDAVNTLSPSHFPA
jgi:hypothetical protein